MMRIAFQSACLAIAFLTCVTLPSLADARNPQHQFELAPTTTTKSYKSCSVLGGTIPDSYRGCLICEASGIGSAKYANYACWDGTAAEMPPCAAPSGGKACALAESYFCRAYGGPIPHLDVGETACVMTGYDTNPKEEYFELRHCRGPRDQYAFGPPITKGVNDELCDRFIYPKSYKP